MQSSWNFQEQGGFEYIVDSEIQGESHFQPLKDSCWDRIHQKKEVLARPTFLHMNTINDWKVTDVGWGTLEQA